MISETKVNDGRAMKRFLIVAVIGCILISGVYWWFIGSGSDEPKPGEVSIVANPIQNKAQLSPRDAAVNFFSACAAGDWSTASTYCSYVAKLHDELDGMKLIKVGQPHKYIPFYPGLHIPYEIKLKSGDTKKFILAIRNDNPTKAWKVDGEFSLNSKFLSTETRLC